MVLKGWMNKNLEKPKMAESNNDFKELAFMEYIVLILLSLTK